MKTMTSWETVLAAPSPCDHLVQLYTSERVLVGTVGSALAVSRFLDV